MRWTSIFIFVIVFLANLSFLAFACIFFFVPEARSIGFGLIFLTIFIWQQTKTGGIKETISDLKDMKKYDEYYERVIEINKRYSFKNKSFIKKKKLLKMKGLI